MLNIRQEKALSVKGYFLVYHLAKEKEFAGGQLKLFMKALPILGKDF
jgi:hypothetical protein